MLGCFFDGISLMLMTLLAMASGALHRGELPWWGLTLVIGASLIKAQQILANYLDLRIAPSAWRGGLLIMVGVMEVIMYLGIKIMIEMKGKENMAVEDIGKQIDTSIIEVIEIDIVARINVNKRGQVVNKILQ